MNYLILDTSSIIFSISNKKDIFVTVKRDYPTYTILISKGIVKELEKIAKGRSKDSKHARVAISLLSRYSNLKVAKNSSYVDSWIVKEANNLGAVVCSNDSKLKQALKSKGIEVLSATRDGFLR